MLNHEEIQKLKEEIFSEADNRYVAIDVCNEKQDAAKNKFADNDKRIDIIAHEFGTAKKLLWAIASASLGSFVAKIFEMLF